MARYRTSVLTMLAVGALALTACSRDMTSPSATTTLSKTAQRASSFRPSAAAKALYGVTDGTYTITVDPTQDQSLNIGLNHLDLPANSICALASSSYGVGHWNEACTPETDTVVLTVQVSGATSDYPRVDFHPAMRFNPSKNVQLFMYAPNPSLSDSWTLNYCNDLNVCVDESKSDSEMQSYIDYDASVVFRRVKHFTGYIIRDKGDVESEAAH